MQSLLTSIHGSLSGSPGREADLVAVEGCGAGETLGGGEGVDSAGRASFPVSYATGRVPAGHAVGGPMGGKMAPAPRLVFKHLHYRVGIMRPTDDNEK